MTVQCWHEHNLQIQRAWLCLQLHCNSAQCLFLYRWDHSSLEFSVTCPFHLFHKSALQFCSTFTRRSSSCWVLDLKTPSPKSFAEFIVSRPVLYLVSFHRAPKATGWNLLVKQLSSHFIFSFDTDRCGRAKVDLQHYFFFICRKNLKPCSVPMMTAWRSSCLKASGVCG